MVESSYGANAIVPFQGKPFVFYNFCGIIQREGSYFENNVEAEAVVEIVVSLVSQARNDLRSTNWLRVVTLYYGQRILIECLLKEKGLDKISVGAVDSSQGCKVVVVVLSFVRGGSTAGFLKDDRRINVALTRAKHQLICIGNVYGLQELRESKARTSTSRSRRVLKINKKSLREVLVIHFELRSVAENA